MNKTSDPTLAIERFFQSLPATPTGPAGYVSSGLNKTDRISFLHSRTGAAESDPSFRPSSP